MLFNAIIASSLAAVALAAPSPPKPLGECRFVAEQWQAAPGRPMGWIEGKAFDASNATVNEFDIPLSEGPAPKTIEGFPEKLEMWREQDGFEAPVFFRYGQDLEMVSNEEPCVQGEYDDEMFAHRRLSCHWPC